MFSKKTFADVTYQLNDSSTCLADSSEQGQGKKLLDATLHSGRRTVVIVICPKRTPKRASMGPLWKQDSEEAFHYFVW